MHFESPIVALFFLLNRTDHRDLAEEQLAAAVHGETGCVAELSC
jgi:hypothetical protein